MNPDLVIALPLRLTNPLNGSHKHWAVKARARKEHRSTVALALNAPLSAFREIIVRQAGGAKSLLVTVIRVAPRQLDPHDGLPASCKGVVDGIADALDIDDRDPRIMWTYDQKKGSRPNQYGVEIHLTKLESYTSGCTY